LIHPERRPAIRDVELERETGEIAMGRGVFIAPGSLFTKRKFLIIDAIVIPSSAGIFGAFQLAKAFPSACRTRDRGK